MAKEKKKLTNLEKFALKELKRIEDSCSNEDDLEGQQMVTNDIMQLISVFAKQGHSGFSASYVIRFLTRLLDWKPIGKLTGEDDEWEDIDLDMQDESISQQNLRCPAVFRVNKDNSTAFYLYGKVFSDDGGRTWFTNGDSKVAITFPYYVPDRPEYVYLDKEEKKGES